MAKPETSESDIPDKSVDSYKIGDVLVGTVTCVEANLAHVSARGHHGIVPKGQVSNERVDDVREFLNVGEGIEVKVIDKNLDEDELILPRKKCL